jgi:hypothetical protein
MHVQGAATDDVQHLQPRQMQSIGTRVSASAGARERELERVALLAHRVTVSCCRPP